jgi:hypothetical protein
MPSYYPPVPGPVTRPLSASPPGPAGAAIVNQWAGTFTQPVAFGTTPSALQSLVIPLDSGTNVGSGSGTPTAGNWLVAITGMNEQATSSGFTIGVADDIHSWWRPAKVSTATALTRCSVWYTPNIARVVNDVYIAPNGAMNGLGALVLEISGLGPWDVLTVTDAAYAAAATTLNLATGAPSAASFMLAAVAGDNDSASQAFAPAGWTTLHTVTATNGTNHVSDVVLTSAYLASNSSSVSVNGTASSAEDLSGVIIGIELNAPSPITGTGVSPAWPGRMILEAAFGAGFETPQDQLTWTTLNDSAVAPGPGVTKRFMGWADQGGIPYALAGLQSGTGTVTLDDADGALTPSNSASPYYPDVVTGTPIRLRAALGTLTGPLGATVVNRWYIVQRNMLDAQEKRDSNMRTFVDMSLTDIWSVVSGSCPSPYRGEVRQDNPYAWWPMDDQPLAGGVLPTSLRNAAAGNNTVLTIEAAAGGVTAGDTYTVGGLDATNLSSYMSSPIAPSVAIYAVGQQQGWMYGDPQSSPASYATSNPVTSSPGSAAWQVTGLVGDTGSNGWFLACNDSSFPALAGGITVGFWFNAAFFGTSVSWNDTAVGPDTYYDLCGQPYANITLAELATASAPVAVLQLDRATGHLNLITYNGGTGTTTAIYTGSDLRSASWHQVVLTATTTTWAVYVDGGLTAKVTGTATGMTSAWTWLLLNGDLGTSGGSSLSSIVHSGNVAYSHCEVYSQILPAWRILARYAAATTGFGVLPAPQTVTASLTETRLGQSFTPDGSEFGGNYGLSGPTTPVPFTFSGLAAAVAGSYTSGSSARVTIAGQGQNDGSGDFWGAAAWVSFTSLAPQVRIYTSASAGAETEAAAVCGSGDSFTGGYGSGATGGGVCQISGGTGASPPSGPSALGDTASQRIERILGYGLVTSPNRAIDTTPQLVQAALDIGGQQTGANCQAMVSSDNGMLFLDNPGTLSYRAKAHLAADTAIWDLSSAGPSSGYPFQPGQVFANDPQKVYDVVQVTPYSPDGASLPVVIPSNATAVNAAQQQYGPRPLGVTSYLQSGTAQQSQANWLFSTYGSVQRRVEALTVNAAGYPPAWLFVLGANVSDVIQVTDQPMQGGPRSTGTYRITSLSRRIFFGANGSRPEASIQITADPIPSSYWS